MRYELAFVKGQAAEKWGDALSVARLDHGCRPPTPANFHQFVSSVSVARSDVTAYWT